MILPKLSKIEIDVLKRKYIANGLSWEEAQQKLDIIVEHLEKLTTTLKTKNKPIEEIESKFRMEFEKLCMKAEK